jgi:hypothetical protein
VAAVAARAGAFARSLPDHQLLDRIVRGRAWIPLLGILLTGIVAMQVEVLKLGASIGRSIERSTALQSRNELLRSSVASLADEQRIERLAAAMGMVMPAPEQVGFLSAGAKKLSAALQNVHPPNAAGFMSLLTGNGAVVTASSLQQGVGQSATAPTSASTAQTGLASATQISSAASQASPQGQSTQGPTTQGPTPQGPTPQGPPAQPTPEVQATPTTSGAGQAAAQPASPSPQTALSPTGAAALQPAQGSNGNGG